MITLKFPPLRRRPQQVDPNSIRVFRAIVGAWDPIVLQVSLQRDVITVALTDGEAKELITALSTAVAELGTTKSDALERWLTEFAQ